MNAIDRVVRECASPSEPIDYRAVKAELDRVEAERAKMLGVERSMRGHLASKIGHLQATLECRSLYGKYPALDLSFLRWGWCRRKYPRFAVFQIRDGLCSMLINRGGYVMEAPAFYCDAHRDLPKRWFWLGPDVLNDVLVQEVRIRCEFAGVLPDPTRAKIKDALPDFGGSYSSPIYIVQETTKKDWKAEKIRAPKDPLVIGVKEGRAFLIDQFDVTPAEDYILTTHVGLEG